MKIEELNLSAVKYFIDAVETGSISRSSQMNYVSRPAVSQAILRLGEWYGHKLLKHEKRNFALTSHGEDFYRQAKQSLEVLKKNFDSKTDNSKALKLGCSASLVGYLMPALKSGLQQAEAPVLKFGTTKQILKALEEKEINLAVAVDKKDHTEFKSQVIRTGQFKLYSKSGRLENILLKTEERPETLSLQNYFAKKKIQIETQIQIESWSEAARLAQILQACCLIPDYIDPKGLKPIELKEWNSAYQLKAYFRNTFELSSIEKDLLEKLSKLS